MDTVQRTLRLPADVDAALGAAAKAEARSINSQIMVMLRDRLQQLGYLPNPS